MKWLLALLGGLAVALEIWVIVCLLDCCREEEE